MELWQTLIKNNIDYEAHHIPGVCNVRADFFSRSVCDRHDYYIGHDTFSDILSLLNFTPTRIIIDLFASKFSCKLPCYVSLFPHPGAICIDAFSFSWTNTLYAFPPLPVISRVVNKLVSVEATNFVPITPGCPGLVCLPLLLFMLFSHPIFISSHLLLGEIPTLRPFNLMARPIFTSVGDVHAYQKLALKPLPPVSRLPHYHVTEDTGESFVNMLEQKGHKVHCNVLCN